MNVQHLLGSLLAVAFLTACGGASETSASATDRSQAVDTSSSAQAADASSSTPDPQAAADLSQRLLTAGQIQQADQARMKDATLAKVGADRGTQLTVYRFWIPAQGAHFYTASETEKDAVIAGLPNFIYEGEAFYAHSDAAMGLTPVYRFLNTLSGTHFYTVSPAEKSYIESSIPELTYEGVAFHAAIVPSNGFVPAYRFFHPARATHFYTRSEQEKATLMAADSGYVYEGQAFRVLPTADTAAPVLSDVFPAAGESVPTTVAHVNGKVSDNVAVKSVSLRMGDVTIPATLSGGGFSAKLPLQPGSNSYTIVAEDHAGNRLESVASAYLGSRAAGGGSHSGAIRNGLLHTVGRNNMGQLGFGNTSVLADGESVHPTSMRQIMHGAQTPVSLMFNQNFSLMLDSAGQVWSWGYNASGQLGLGTCSDPMVTASQHSPAQVSSLSSVRTIAAGYDHSLALRSDGTVWAFGQNNVGQLGDGSTTNRDCPVQVQGLPGDAAVIQVAAGSQSSYALDDKGRVWAWGRNQYGNLGQGTTSGSTVAQTSPVQVPLEASVVMLASGRDHVLALTDKGSVMGWGLNASYQLSDEWASPVSTPAVLPSLPAGTALRVWANGNSSWVMKEVGVPYRWGQRLGNSGTDFPTANLPYPQRVSAALSGVLDVGPGASHWVVLKSTGDFVSLGWSFEASLGAGPSTINTWAYVEPISVVFP